MKLQRSSKDSWGKTGGKGFILYGNRPDNGTWLERWYPSMEKALSFCAKRAWKVEILC